MPSGSVTARSGSEKFISGSAGDRENRVLNLNSKCSLCDFGRVGTQLLKPVQKLGELSEQDFLDPPANLTKNVRRGLAGLAPILRRIGRFNDRSTQIWSAVKKFGVDLRPRPTRHRSASKLARGE